MEAKQMSRVAIAFLAAVLMAGCTDAKRAQFSSIGSPGDIECYSGTLLIFKGRSTGKIATEGGSDGWFFEDAATHKLIRISGVCVIKN